MGRCHLESKLPTASSRSGPGGKGMHARKISFDGGANGDLQVMRELGYPKNMIFYQKWSPKGPKWSRKRPKWSQNGPEWGRKGAKSDQSGAKGEPKSTKSDQKGAKREPKGDQNAYKNRCPKKVAKGCSQKMETYKEKQKLETPKMKLWLFHWF